MRLEGLGDPKGCRQMLREFETRHTILWEAQILRRGARYRKIKHSLQLRVNSAKIFHVELRLSEIKM